MFHRSWLRFYRAIRPHLNYPIDDHDIIRLHSRFYYPQSFGQLSRLYMTQPGNILGIHNIHKALILIRTDRPIGDQERVVFRARGYSDPDKVSGRQKPIGVRKCSPDEERTVDESKELSEKSMVPS